MTEIVKITGVPDRVAYTKVSGGQLVPHDKVITVPLNPWIKSRIDAGDIALVTGEATARRSASGKTKEA